ncbi:MAG: HAMP domain-containing histidine kinase, partial [Verrucomicrobiae bacterium]|nr:HAMP domain-containing histidine kinase [Verrucomicrobiae bacterium]
GTDIQQELMEVDSNILTYAGGAFLLAGLLGGCFLYWAFRKLRQVNLLLQERTQRLISANQKLSMEARTAAIGAITSHLIHGLKGPLQGIRQFVSAHSSDTDKTTGEDVWLDAANTTERMQGLINEVMEVLQDRSSEFTYDITGSEIGQLVEERVLAYAEKKRVSLKIEEEGAVDQFPVTNDRGSLIILILVNLLRNAIDASPAGSVVGVRICAESKKRLVFFVTDKGDGLPKTVLEHLFQPVRSTKADGSGVGLSLCQELSRHLRGELELAQTGPQGTVFKLSITQDA